MKRGLVIFIVVIAILSVTGYLYVTHSGEIGPARATLAILTGKASILRSDGQQNAVEAGKQAAVGAGDTIQIDGRGTLTYVGAQAELWPGTKLSIKQYNIAGGDSQIDLLLQSGQVLQLVEPNTGPQPSYSLSTGAATMLSRGGKLLARIAKDGGTQVGVAYGTATVTGKATTVSLKDNQGTIVEPGKAPTAAQPWTQVNVPTYRADGSTVTLPISLQDEKSGERYDFSSDEMFLVPVGTYTMIVNLVAPYQANNITLTASGLNELPVTLGEVFFQTTDTTGHPVDYTGLAVKNGDQSVRVVPDAPLIVSPGDWKVNVAREEKPDAAQPVNLSISPGQRVTIPLRNDLFGGGAVKVDFSAPEGATVGPLTISAYQKGNEDGDPYAVFKSDTPSEPLPAGDYVLVVQSRIGARYPVTIPENQTVSVPVAFSVMTVSYVDNQNKPLQRGVMVYIASATESTRLGLKPDEMRKTPFGIAVTLTEAKKLLVPAGSYDVLINDHPPAEKDNNPVPPGQAVTVAVQAGTQ